MQPLNNYIVCKELKKQESSGFIYTSDSKFEELEVVAVPTSQNEVKEKDIVKVMKTSGDKDEDYRIIRSTDIIYVL